MKKTATIIALLLAALMLFSACGEPLPPVDPSTPDTPDTPSTPVVPEPPKEMKVIPFADVDVAFTNTSIMDFTYSAKDKNATYSSYVNVNLTESVTISKAGTYLVTGTLENGKITVDAGDLAKVQLVLAGVNIKNENGPALYIKSADKVHITLKDGTENFLADGSAYTATDDGKTLDSAIYSRADLAINGTGSLTVNGNLKHGIDSKDDLVITGGNIKVTAVKVALNGKDCVKIGGGTLTLEAGSDGVRSDNVDDADRGFVYISGGDINITAGSDGIQAQTVVKIDGGNVNVNAGGASTAATALGKGIVAERDILITGGKISVDSSDDAISTNMTANISGGELVVKTGDEGICAESAILISGGSVNVEKSYDGLKADAIHVSGGTTGVVVLGGIALEYTSAAYVTGGVLVSLGNAEEYGFSEAENQGAMICTFTQQKAGVPFAVVDSTGKTVATLTSSRAYTTAVVTAPELKNGGTYTLTSDGAEITKVTMTSDIHK